MLLIFADIAGQVYEAATLAGVLACLLLCLKAELSRRDVVAVLVLGYGLNILYHAVLLDLLPSSVNLNVPRVIAMAGGIALLALVVAFRRPRSFDRVLVLASAAALFTVTTVNHLLLVEGIMESRVAHYIQDHKAAFTAQTEYSPAMQNYCATAKLECIVLPRNADNSLAPHDHQIPLLTKLETAPPHFIMAGRVVDPIENAQVTLLINYPQTTLLVRDRAMASQLFYTAERWFRFSLFMFMALWGIGMVLLIRTHQRMRQRYIEAEEIEMIKGDASPVPADGE